MQRVSINVSCARAVKELRLTGKDIFSAEDIRAALTAVGRGSVTSQKDYMGSGGYLATRAFIERTPGGWILTDSSMKHKKIEVHIAVGNEYLLGEVSAAITEALEGFRGVTHTVMEV